MRYIRANDYVGLSFNSTDLTHGPAILSFRLVRDLTPEDIPGTREFGSSKCRRNRYRKRFYCAHFNVAELGSVSNRLTREDVAKRSILQLM